MVVANFWVAREIRLSYWVGFYIGLDVRVHNLNGEMMINELCVACDAR